MTSFQRLWRTAKVNNTWPFKILVKLTSRGRKQRFFDTLDNIYLNCAQPDYMRVLITADLDDPEMNNEEVKSRVAQFPNTHLCYGYSESKIDAINKHFDCIPEEWKDWTILLNVSDDQRFTMFGYDELVRVDFKSVFPETLLGYMAYRDPDTHGALSTLLCVGRPFYDKFGFVYDPAFKSLFCDTLLEECAKHLGLYHYTGYDIYRHYNSSYGYKDFPADEMYIEQQKIGWSVDQALYDKIMAKGIPEYLKQFNL